MKQLLRATTAYRLFAADAERGCAAHTTLILFPDEAYLREMLTVFAQAFFRAREGGRTASLIEKESLSDCRFYPAKGEKYTADGVADLLGECALRPVEEDRRLFVLDAFHTATPLVQNKLLKALEEPPEGVYFLLGATAEHAVLPTVLSRAKKLSVPPFSEAEVLGVLRRHHVREEGLEEAAAACGGVYSVAEALLAGGGEDFRLAERFLGAADTEQLCREIGEKKTKTFFPAVRLVLRDLLFLRTGREGDCARRGPAMRSLAEEYPAGALLAAIGFVTEAEQEIRFNANPGQAAYALALRIQKEKARWQRLS